MLLSLSVHLRELEEDMNNMFILDKILSSTTFIQVALYTGFYDVYAYDWLTVFPRHQLYFSIMDDFQDNGTTVLNEMFKFLGIGNCLLKCIFLSCD